LRSGRGALMRTSIPQVSPAIEVSHGGHTVRIVKGDHPAARGRGGWHPRHRVAICSCGALPMLFACPEEARNARRAEQWADNHCRHSNRVPRPNVKWARSGWVLTVSAARANPSAIPTERGTTMLNREEALLAQRERIDT